MIKKHSYEETPARYQYAPRTMSEAFRDADYATAVWVYPPEPTSAKHLFLIGVAAVLCLALLYYGAR